MVSFLDHSSVPVFELDVHSHFRIKLAQACRPCVNVGHTQGPHVLGTRPVFEFFKHKPMTIKLYHICRSTCQIFRFLRNTVDSFSQALPERLQRQAQEPFRLTRKLVGIDVHHDNSAPLRGGEWVRCEGGNWSQLHSSVRVVASDIPLNHAETGRSQVPQVVLSEMRDGLSTISRPSMSCIAKLLKMLLKSMRIEGLCFQEVATRQEQPRSRLLAQTVVSKETSLKWPAE